jgi:hypothetical protein
VALVFVPHLPGTGAHGAVRWIGETPVVQLSIRGRRGRRADVVWFTLFHELGHVLLHGRQGPFIEFDGVKKDPAEKDADTFARDTLIPPAEFQSFRSTLPGGHVSERKVRTFAAAIRIDPGIVVGRLQHEGILPRTHLNQLRTRIQWSNEVSSR